MKICKRIKATVLSLCLIIGMCAASLPQTVRAEYGDNAYAFMKQLQSNYPYRQVIKWNAVRSRGMVKVTDCYDGL
mgnify:CR=1 FL=1